MVIKIAEYKIKKEAEKDVRAAVSAFLRAIRENEPDTFYGAFRKEDSWDFFHLMKFPDAEAEQRHVKAPYTADFTKVLYPNCKKGPVFTNLSAIE